MKIEYKSKEPFYFAGNGIGCLLVHGFTGSPAEMRYLGEALNDQGYTVYGVLLAGHGETPEAMKESNWQHWYESVRKGIEYLAEECEEVFVIGLSMGGLLSLRAAAINKEVKLKGVVSICAPIYLQDKKSYLTPVAQYFKPYYRKKISSKDEALNKDNDRFTYFQIPLSCVASLVNLIKKTKGEFSRIDLPTLVIQSEIDPVVVPKSGDYIFNKVGTEKKQLIWLKRSGHLATIDVERELVATEIIKFISKNRGDNWKL
ncbi:carboxylesterase [Desulfitispora alkaliphila]